MNRRAFIAGLGTFMILPGAGRIWRARREVPMCNPIVTYFSNETISKTRPLMPYQLNLDELFDQMYAIQRSRAASTQPQP